VKRCFDISAGLILFILLVTPILLVAVTIKFTSKGSVLYWSERVGKENVNFMMPKFRSMLSDTPQLATHLMNDPNKYLSPIGGVLRRSSLDEIPQIFSVFKGDMSFVGPRPALYNQDDLIAMRTEKGVDKLIPGLTGWAQVNGRDELPIPEKVALDVEYMERQSFLFDMYILWLTILKVVRREGVSH
jgi:O-antigen biosynthesis protein WbqP